MTIPSSRAGRGSQVRSLIRRNAHEMIRQAAEIMHDDAAGIWIAAINDVMCFTDTLGGLSHEPHYLYVYWPHDLYREQ